MNPSTYVWIGLGIIAIEIVRHCLNHIIKKRALEWAEQEYDEEDTMPNPEGYCDQFFTDPELTGVEVRRLVAEGNDPTICNANGYTPLFFQHTPDAVQALYEAGVNPHAADAEGWNMLHHMAIEDCGAEPRYARAIVELAHRCGVNINARTTDAEDDKLTPLAMALNADEGSADIARLLLEFGADPNQTSFYLEEDNAGKEHFVEYTPLQRCIRYADLMLVAAGADVSKVSEDDKWTPLQVAVAKGQIYEVQQLLANDADANGTSGYTPMEIAAFFNRVEIMKLLIANGANLKATEPNAETPLHLAVWYGSADAVQYLIEMGADVEQRLYGYTPLMRVCERYAESPCNAEGYLKTAETLLHAGANPDATHAETHGKHTWLTTPLSCTEADSPMRKLLITYGATNEGGKQ